jgi:hypothetical protein
MNKLALSAAIAAAALAGPAVADDFASVLPSAPRVDATRYQLAQRPTQLRTIQDYVAARQVGEPRTIILSTRDRRVFAIDDAARRL